MQLSSLPGLQCALPGSLRAPNVLNDHTLRAKLPEICHASTAVGQEVFRAQASEQGASSSHALTFLPTPTDVVSHYPQRLPLCLFAQGPYLCPQAKLLEHNVRFGDPECQCLMTRLQSDLLPLLLAASDPQGVRGSGLLGMLHGTASLHRGAAAHKMACWRLH